MHWVFEPFRRYADFSGRSRRTEFWSFILFQWVVYITLGVLAIVGFGAFGVIASSAPTDAQAVGAGIGLILLFAIVVLFWLATLIPNLSVAARRMQDQDIPGWIGVLLVIGGWLFSLPLLVMAVFGFFEGTRGSNRFGPDPKADGTADTFA